MAEPFRPLAGTTVLAWEQAVSLPMATRLLADLGATVIRLESHVRSAQRPRHLANDLARNKLSLALDLRAEQGQAIFKRLVGAVDVLCENFTPRVKRGFGLTYEQLKAERDDLIMLSLSGYGQTGPWSERPTYGPGIEAAAGQAQSMGYPDQPPTRPGTVVYADNVSGFYAAFAILAALRQRQETGRGRYIDLAMYEANAFHLGLSIARSSITGQPQARRGNADPDVAVQGVYATRDDGGWLAVTVRPDQVGALADLLGAPHEPSALEAALSAWVAAHTATDAAEALQAAEIAAAPALNAREVLTNAQLRHRQAFTEVAHEQPVNGYRAHPHGASPWRFGDRPRPALTEAPAVGQDSCDVLRRWLELTDGEIDELIAAGVVGVPQAGPAKAAPMPSEKQIRQRLGWRLLAGYDADPGVVLGLTRCDEAGDDAGA